MVVLMFDFFDMACWEQNIVYIKLGELNVFIANFLIELKMKRLLMCIVLLREKCLEFRGALSEKQRYKQVVLQLSFQNFKGELKLQRLPVILLQKKKKKKKEKKTKKNKQIKLVTLQYSKNRCLASSRNLNCSKTPIFLVS
eukprot:TRINITY_DN14158_c0_g1_i1.p3 TRINITY_DN14158_c0_g1~~TRINITY_DN14158_c0_g1_i1.p3  ORF type:complete len:141 (-),score=15.59 TRINITY_DN14158_c0_g1_i1:157-579(-)